MNPNECAVGHDRDEFHRISCIATHLISSGGALRSGPVQIATRLDMLFVFALRSD